MRDEELENVQVEDVEFEDDSQELESNPPTYGKSDIVHSFGWSFLEQGGSKFILMLVQLVLARLLDPHAFGVLAILLVFTNMADVISQSGLGLALIQRSDSTDETYSTAFWLSMAIATCLYATLFFGSPFIATFYDVADLSVLLQVMSLVVFFNAANSIQRSFLQRAMDFKRLCISNVLGVIASGVVGVIMAITGFGVWALVGQMLVQSIAACIALLWFVPWKPRFVFKTREARELISYGWKICVTGIVGVFNTSITDLVIGKACNISDLGYYNQGKKWPHAAIGVLTNAIQNVLFPAFSAKKDNPDKFLSSVKHALKLGSFLVIPVSLMATVMSEPLVLFLLTDKWIASVPIFQLTCLGNCVLMIQLVNLRAYMAMGNSGLYLKLQIEKVALAILLICGTALITRNIYWTAVSALAFSYLGILGIDLAPSRRELGYSRMTQIRDVLPFFLLGLLASLCSLPVLLLPIPPLLQCILQFLVFSLVYVGGAWIAHLDQLHETVDLFLKLIGR